MTDPSQLSDAELFAIAGIQPPAAPAPAAPAAPRREAPRPQPRAYTGQLPTDPEAVFGALVMQESGGRAGVLGPETQWGRAQGRTQMLPATAQEMAQRLGVPWRPELMTGISPEAAAYQDRLGLEYLRQGYEQTGNMRDALRYYHGGPDRALWGPKTNAYAEEVLNRFAGGDAAPYRVVREQDLAPEDTPESLRAQGYEQDPNTGRWFRYVGQEQAPDLTAMSDAELMALAGVEAPTQEPDTRTEGHRLALEQERANRELTGYNSADFTSQVTAPINDELSWLSGYLGQSLGNIGRSLTGRDIEVSALDRARAARDLSREEQEAFQRENPGQAIAGGVLGGFAFGPGRAAAAVPLLGRLGQAGGVSAAYGAAEGDGVGGRVGSAALSGVLGVGTAGALEGVAPLARGALRGIERARAPRASLPNRQEARVGSAIENAIVTRDQMTPDQVIANMAEGRLPFAAGGENLLGLAETAAQAPGQARAALVRTAKEVQDGATNRVQQQLSDQFGADGNFYVTLRDRVRQQRDTAKQGMDAMADTLVPLDDASVQAFRSGLSSRAVRDAAEEAIADMSPEGAAAANRLFGLGDQVLDNPGAATITVREAQDISYALREAASRAYRGGFNSRGEALQNLSTAIRQNARERVKPYDAWLKQYGDDAEANDALRVGKNLFARPTERNAMSVPELRERWADWSDLAKENFRLGVGEAVLDRVRAGGGVPALRRVLKDQDVAERIALAFGGEDEFARFMQFATDETTLQGQLNQILGNSSSARRLAGRADLEAQGMDPLDLVEGAADFTNPISAAGRVSKEVLRRLPRKDRSILGDAELNGLLGRALTDETEMTRLLNLLQNRSALNNRVAGRARALGLLSTPAVAGAGQERVRGLLTATP